MVQIRVLDVIGPICVDPEDGTVLCTLTRNALSQGSVVKLDFEGVRTLTGSFLISAVGCLRATFSAEIIRDNLSWDGLDARIRPCSNSFSITPTGSMTPARMGEMPLRLPH